MLPLTKINCNPLSLAGKCWGGAVLALLFLLVSCGPEGNTFRIKGKFRDMQAGELYLYNLSDENARFDTLAIANGSFMYKGEVQETTPYMLVFPNGMEQVIFVSGGQDIKYEATANDLKNYVVNGGDENKLMNKFRHDTYSQSPSQTVATAREYIIANPTSMAAVYLFQYYFADNPEVGIDEMASVLEVLKSSQPDSKYVKDIDRRIAIAGRCAVGKTLPDITLTRRDKSTRKLWAAERDFNLIAFWATWLPGGYDMAWNFNQLYSTYSVSARLRMVAVSLDIERHQWEEYAPADSLAAIEHYCDGLGFESPVAKQLGITTLPFFILTDRSHKIVAQTTSYNKIKTELEGKLKEDKAATKK